MLKQLLGQVWSAAQYATGRVLSRMEANLFFQLFSDPMKQHLNFHILTNDMIQIEWIYKQDCQPEGNKTIIYLATFTTCWARLKLYSVLEKLDKRVLYYDTDSVIYSMIRFWAITWANSRMSWKLENTL